MARRTIAGLRGISEQIAAVGQDRIVVVISTVLPGTLRKHIFPVLDEHMKGRQFAVGDAVTVADFVLAYTLDWANEVQLLDGFPRLQAYMERMYARPHAPLRIAKAFASLNA
jgi:glutathione S-transferase